MISHWTGTALASLTLLVCAILLSPTLNAETPMRTTCYHARLDCQNGGYVEECLETIHRCPYECRSRCICPVGYFGVHCQFLEERLKNTCPVGTTYSNAGLNTIGPEEIECHLSSQIDVPGIMYLRDHRSRLVFDTLLGKVTMEVFSRPFEMFKEESGPTILMFGFTATNCSIIEKQVRNTKQVVYRCLRKTVRSCRDHSEDRVGCPVVVSMAFKQWQKRTEPLEFIFNHDKQGRAIGLNVVIGPIRFMGSLRIKTHCFTGSCITPYPSNSVIKLHQEEEIIEQPESFIAVAIASLTIVAGMVLALGTAVVRVKTELYKTPPVIKDSLDKTYSASSISTIDPLDPDPKKDASVHGILWQSLSYRLPSLWMTGGRGVELLHPSSGVLTGPELVALIGRSGCGKSTFLDLLAGVHKPGVMSGRIGMIGAATTIGYMTQHDVMLSSLTVWETISFAGKTRFPADVADEDINGRIATILMDVGLENHAHSLVSGLSGGERRRLALAADLISQPDVLLLDEPTTGLDSANALLVVNLLRNRVIMQSRLVIMTIHQPSSDLLPLFDRVILMGSYGRIIFNGTPQAALQFVIRHTSTELAPSDNPFEFILESLDDGPNMDRMLSEYQIQEIVSNESIDAMIPAVDQSSHQHLSFFSQVSILCKRSFRNSARATHHLLLFYVITVAVALALGVTFFNLNRQLSGGIVARFGFFSCSSLFLSLISLSSLDLLLTERIIQRRECPTSYSCLAYMTAKLLTDIVPYRLIPAIIFSSITYGMIGLQPVLVKFLLFTSVVILVSTAAGASAMLISFLTSDFRSANFVSILYFLFNFCFGSTLISRNDGGVVGTLRYLSFFSYATESLSALEFDGLRITLDSQIVDVDNALKIDGDEFLTTTGMNVSNLSFDISMLVVCIGIIYVLAFLALRFDTRKTRRHCRWQSISADESSM
uniref:ABC transporter domain-containing protein n=1 Tax=Spongospora subterranea TaxID=70186 RepID=A0A0H5QIH1_9EUKA|eukprot:CRZ01121.1 hypothetical protein [Spongospora subterranea]